MAHRSYSWASVLTVVYGVLVGLGYEVSATELREIMREKARTAHVRGNWAELVESLSVKEVFTALRALVNEEGSGVKGRTFAGGGTHFWVNAAEPARV